MAGKRRSAWVKRRNVLTVRERQWMKEKPQGVTDRQTFPSPSINFTFAVHEGRPWGEGGGDGGGEGGQWQKDVEKDGKNWKLYKLAESRRNFYPVLSIKLYISSRKVGSLINRENNENREIKKKRVSINKYNRWVNM